MNQKKNQDKLERLKEKKELELAKLAHAKEVAELKAEIDEIKNKKNNLHSKKLGKTLKRVGKNIKEDLKSAGKGLAKAGRKFSDYYYREGEHSKDKKPDDKGMMGQDEDWGLKDKGMI